MIPPQRPWEEAAEFTIGLKPIPLEAWLEGGEADPAADLRAYKRFDLYDELVDAVIGDA